MSNLDYKNSTVDIIKHIHEDDLQDELNRILKSKKYKVIDDIKIVSTNAGGKEMLPKDWQHSNIIVFYNNGNGYYL